MEMVLFSLDARPIAPAGDHGMSLIEPIKVDADAPVRFAFQVGRVSPPVGAFIQFLKLDDQPLWIGVEKGPR